MTSEGRLNESDYVNHFTSSDLISKVSFEPIHRAQRAVRKQPLLHSHYRRRPPPSNRLRDHVRILPSLRSVLWCFGALLVGTWHSRGPKSLTLNSTGLHERDCIYV